MINQSWWQTLVICTNDFFFHFSFGKLQVMKMKNWSPLGKQLINANRLVLSSKSFFEHLVKALVGIPYHLFLPSWFFKYVVAILQGICGTLGNVNAKFEIFSWFHGNVGSLNRILATCQQTWRGVITIEYYCQVLPTVLYSRTRARNNRHGTAVYTSTT